jgi:hypothetical protein
VTYGSALTTSWMGTTSRIAMAQTYTVNSTNSIKLVWTFAFQPRLVDLSDLYILALKYSILRGIHPPRSRLTLSILASNRIISREGTRLIDIHHGHRNV